MDVAPRPTAEPAFLIRALLAAAVGIGLALALRHGLIEPREIGFQCGPGAAPWWCGLRRAVLMAYQSNGLGWAGLATGAAALFLGWRGAALLALLVGGAGLVLYNTGLAAIGVLGGMVAAVRIARG